MTHNEWQYLWYVHPKTGQHQFYMRAAQWTPPIDLLLLAYVTGAGQGERRILMFPPS